MNRAVSSAVTVRRWNQTAMSSERLQNCGNERIREEVRRIREKYERCTRSRHRDEIALSSGATAVSSQSRLDATPRDNTWCLRSSTAFLSLGYRFKARRHNGADMIFPGVGRVTHRRTRFASFCSRVRVPSQPRSKIHRPPRSLERNCTCRGTRT